MGKKRKSEENSKNWRFLFQNSSDDCREPWKMQLFSRTRSRFDNTPSSGVLPVTANRVLKKVSYTKAKCHPVGITSTSASTIEVRNRHRAISTGSCRKRDTSVAKIGKPAFNDDDDDTYELINDCQLTKQLDNDEVKSPVIQPPLRPLFFEVPQQEEQKYVEREWIYSTIDSIFTSKKNVRGIIVYGGAGTGKTTLALQLVEHSCFGRTKQLPHDFGVSDRILPCSKLASHIVAYHFCQVDNRTTCLVPDFVHSIAAQICQAPALSPYRHFLEENPAILDLLSTKNCLINPHTAFVNGVIDPLIKLQKQNVLPEEYFIILLDSICEAESHKTNARDTFASFISKHILKLPFWLKIIITVRTCQLDLINLLPFKKLSLDSMDENINQDLEQYVNQRFENALKSDSVKNRLRKNDINVLPSLKTHLQQLSGGCLLFLKLTLDLIENGHIVIKSQSFKTLPISLYEVFLLHCNLRFHSQNAFNHVVPILSTCLAALNPLNLLEIYHSVNSLNYKQNLAWIDFLRYFKNVQGLLVKRLDGTYMFFHLSFRDWLLGSDLGNSKFQCNYEMGHAAIALRLLRVEHPLSTTKLLDLAHHMLKAKLFKGNGSRNSKLFPAILLLSSYENISNALCSPSNIYHTNLKVSRLLLLAGATPYSDLPTDKPLLEICTSEGNIGLLALLVEFGADVNARNQDGSTALHVASTKGNLAVVEYLVRHGARLSSLNSRNECPMLASAAYNQLDILIFFLGATWDDNSEMEISKTEAIFHSLVSACGNGCDSVIEPLLENYQIQGTRTHINGETPMTIACKSGHVDTVRLLCKHGVNVNIPDEEGTPPLISSVINGHHRILALLLNQGPKIDAIDNQNRTGLMHAARLDDVISLEILVNHCADLNLRDKDGLSALSWSCLRANQRSCNYLLQFHVNINQTDGKGRTPLHLAACSGSEAIAQALLERGALLEQSDFLGNRALDQAVECSKPNVVHLFLKRGAKLGANTWKMASNKPEIIMILLNKLLEDGRFLLQNNNISEAEHRFQYALRKIPTQFEDDFKSTFDAIRKTFLLEVLKCRRKTNDLQEILKVTEELYHLEPNCSELYDYLEDQFSINIKEDLVDDFSRLEFQLRLKLSSNQDGNN